MGKASKWFRNLFGLKKNDPPPSTTHSTTSHHHTKEKRRWSFVKSYRERAPSAHRQNDTVRTKHASSYVLETSTGQLPSEHDDPNKHAIAVAAATAAVAEAAVAAAQAAAAVVRLTSSSGRCASVNNHPVAYVSSGSCGIREELAAVKIQSVFRGYLARRALRALKGLVRLQALVRGHIERKRTAEWLRRMQALLKAQARVRAGRAQLSESSHSSSNSHFHHPGPPTPEKFEHSIGANSRKHEQSPLRRSGSKTNNRMVGDQDKQQPIWSWSDRKMDERLWDGDKILEIDTGKPHHTPKRRVFLQSSYPGSTLDQHSHSFTTSKDSTHQTIPSPSSGEVQSLSPLKYSHEPEETSFCTANNSPQFLSASSRGGSGRRSPFTPTKSDGSRSYLSGYSDHPSYMAYTESSKAKVRSHSAPKQRPHYERSSSTNRNSVHGFGESRSSSQKVSSLHANFASKAYPGSGRLDRLGMPVGHRY